MNKSKVDVYDVEELAAHLCGVAEEYEESDDPSDFIEVEFLNKFDTPFATFCDIVEHLLPMVMVAQGGLTGKLYRGFADTQNHCWVLKEEIK